MKYKFITTKKRSQLMSKIKSSDTTPEVLFRRKLWGEGIRFSKKVSSLPGKPDIVITKHKVAVFVDGEFWHGYNWKAKKRAIKANKDYWIPKIEKNMKRDKIANAQLKKLGWRVIRFWQHVLECNIDKCANKIQAVIRARKKEKYV